MDTTPNDPNHTDERERRFLAETLARFGNRTHLQPREIAELIGLKTWRPINRAITSGVLRATVLPGCDRLRFVEIDDWLAFMRDNGTGPGGDGPGGNGPGGNGPGGNGPGGNGHRPTGLKRTYVVRDGRALRAREGARSV